MVDEVTTEPATEEATTDSSLVGSVTEPAQEAAETEAAPEKPTEEAKEAPKEFTPLKPDDVKFPEDLIVPEGVKENFLEVLNDQELTPAQRAEKLIELQTGVAKQQQEAWTTMQQEWQAEVKADPEIGGAKFDQNLANVGKLVQEYGSDEFRSVMDMTGAGNNVHVIKFLSKIADQLSEGGPVSGQAPASSEPDIASRLYPSMKKGS